MLHAICRKPVQSLANRPANLVGPLILLLAVIGHPGAASSQEVSTSGWVPIDPEYTLYVEVPDGRIVVALSRDLAQGHVEQMRTLARAGYFDGLQFYRVIDGFLAQGGDFADERPIPGAQALDAEFDELWSGDLSFLPWGAVDQFGEQAGYINGFPVRRAVAEGRVWITHCTGVVGLARFNDPNSADAHFWIGLQPIRANDRQDTVFGRVVWGMELVSTMTRTASDLGDPSRWTPIDSVRVAADIPPAERTPLEMMDTTTFRAHLEERRNPTDPDAVAWLAHSPRNFDVCEAQVPVRVVDRGSADEVDFF